jgi:hypothetical protein
MLNESTTDGTIETLLMVTKLGATQGIFNDTMVREVKGEFMAGIRGSLKSELPKIPAEFQQEFKKIMGFVLNPMERINTIADFITALSKMVIVKKGLYKRFGIRENINESSNFNKILNGLKQKLKQGKDSIVGWWDVNKGDIVTIIAKFLVSVVIGILRGVLGASTKQRGSSGSW